MRFDTSLFRHSIGNKAPIWPFHLNRASPLRDVSGLWLPGSARSGTTVFDLSGNKRHGTFAGASGTGVSWEPTKFGAHGVHVDNGASGGTRHILLPNLWDQNKSDYTWEVFFDYLSNPNVNAISNILAVANEGAQLITINDETGGGSELLTSLLGVIFGVAPLSIGNTYQVVLAKAGTTLSLYLNGVLDSSGAGAAPASSTADIRVGANHNNNDAAGADILVHRVAAWPRTLSAREVRYLYDPATRWNLYREDRVPRVWPAVAAAVSRTAIGSLDAAVRHQASLSAAASAALRAQLALTALSSAALERALLRSAGIDVAVQAIVSAQADLDAALTRSLLAGTALDASVTAQGLSQRAAALDGAVRRLKTLSGTLEAALRADKQGGAELDAPLAMAVEHAAGLDGVARLGFALSDMFLEAALRATPDRAAALDAVIGLIVAAAGSRTFKVAARSGHSIAAPGRRFEIPAGKRRH